jgi:hypothetical protein
LLNPAFSPLLISAVFIHLAMQDGPIPKRHPLSSEFNGNSRRSAPSFSARIPPMYASSTGNSCWSRRLLLLRDDDGRRLLSRESSRQLDSLRVISRTASANGAVTM